jgi:hypothetical protein
MSLIGSTEPVMDFQNRYKTVNEKIELILEKLKQFLNKIIKNFEELFFELSLNFSQSF